MHENEPFPPSLSENGLLRQSPKSSMLDCLSDHWTAREAQTDPGVSLLIIDGATAVNMLMPTTTCKTFGDYASMVFIPFLLRQLQKTSQRLDIVWDAYLSES